MQNALKMKQQLSCTQFDLTKKTLNNLSQFKITPTAKLVLLYLTDCYNPKHKEVFPKQKTIADKLGVSERSVTRAIQELFKAGLILIECKYTNRYKFTSKIIQEQAENVSDNIRQNDIKQDDNLAHHDKEQKKKQKKEQTGINSNSLDFDKIRILKEYAIKHGAKNVNAYIKVLIKNGSAKKIICEYKKQKKAAQIALCSYQETQETLKKYREYENNAVTAKSCGCSLSDLKKRGIIK